MADKRRRYKQRANNLHDEYKRLTRNTKSKLKRVMDDYRLDLSDKISIPKFDELDTPEKFDKWSEEMTSFTDRGNKKYQFVKNKYGVPISLEEIERGVNLTKASQKEIQEFIDSFKENPYSIGGKEAGYTVGDRMTLYEREHVHGISVPDDFDIDVFQTRGRLEGRLELLEEKASGKYIDQSMERLKDNFIKALWGSFNGAAEDVVDMIEIIPADDFFELFIMKAEFTFEDYASDGSIDGTDSQLALLKGYLEEYLRGEVDMDFKHF